MKRALFPGTFDPFTLGHASIVERALTVFDQIVIAIGVNVEKQTLFSVDERMHQIKTCFADNPMVEVCQYEGLTVDFALERGIRCVVRGVRSLTDYEYERQLSDINLRLANIETVCFFTEPTMASIQSNTVRDLLRYHKDVSSFVPATIQKLIQP